MTSTTMAAIAATAAATQPASRWPRMIRTIAEAPVMRVWFSSRWAFENPRTGQSASMPGRGGGPGRRRDAQALS